MHGQVVEQQHVAPTQSGSQAAAHVAGETVLVQELLEELPAPEPTHGQRTNKRKRGAPAQQHCPLRTLSAHGPAVGAGII